MEVYLPLPKEHVDPAHGRSTPYQATTPPQPTPAASRLSHNEPVAAQRAPLPSADPLPPAIPAWASLAQPSRPAPLGPVGSGRNKPRPGPTGAALHGSRIPHAHRRAVRRGEGVSAPGGPVRTCRASVGPVWPGTYVRATAARHMRVARRIRLVSGPDQGTQVTSQAHGPKSRA
jgi:hypothetical protein